MNKAVNLEQTNHLFRLYANNKIVHLSFVPFPKNIWYTWVWLQSGQEDSLTVLQPLEWTLFVVNGQVPEIPRKGGLD